ncbi:MAG: hypothetical protein HXL34_01325 [Prevotellaceae bacterium]|nr:hypothetical protein [Prevotellaceae bacterium]
MQKSPVSESLPTASPASNSLPVWVYDEYNKSYFRASPAGSLNKKKLCTIVLVQSFHY